MSPRPEPPSYHGPFDRALARFPRVTRVESGSRVRLGTGRTWALVLTEGAGAVFMIGLRRSRRYAVQEAEALAHDVEAALRPKRHSVDA